MGYPCVTTDLNKILANVNHLADLLHDRNQTFAAVTKGVCADSRVVEVLEKSRCDWYADSRILNLASIHSKKPRFLIRIAQNWEVPDVVEHTEVGFQSEAATIGLLGAEAARRGKKHKVVLACDLGDLREGCFFRDEADICRTAEAVLAQPCLELTGIGMNLGCFGGVAPCDENLGNLAAIARMLRTKYSIPLPIVSGASTCGIHKLLDGTSPAELNHCRMGELWLNGHDSVGLTDVGGFYQDCFTMSVQLVEIKRKESKPIGPIGGDAFGHVIERPDRGPMLRGIVAGGKQDLDPESLTPRDARIEILGGSGDHTILNLTNAPGYKVGDVLEFTMGYGAMLRAFTSKYVEKRYVDLAD